MAKLLIEKGVITQDEFMVADGFLKVCYVGGEVKAKMQPGNVRPVLEKLHALAKSLESV